MKHKNEIIEIIIADDHAMFLDGISSLLANEQRFSIIGKAKNGKEVVTLLQQSLPDLIILDLSMPEMDGIELTKFLRKKHSSIKILIISTHGNTQTIAKLTRLGVNGYLLKNAEKKELIDAINTIYKGENYFSKEVTEKLKINNKNLSNRLYSTEELSQREKEILTLIAQEYTATEIADIAFISLNTVNTHRRNLLSKLNVKNTAGLVKYAVENGLLD